MNLPQLVPIEESSKNKASENLKTKKHNEKAHIHLSENTKINNNKHKGTLKTLNSEKTPVIKKISCSSPQKSLFSNAHAYQKSNKKLCIVQTEALSPPSFKNNNKNPTKRF